VYLGVVLDAFSRRVIGWSIADHLRAELVADALQMAIWRRQPAEHTVVHSDHRLNLVNTRAEPSAGAYAPRVYSDRWGQLATHTTTRSPRASSAPCNSSSSTATDGRAAMNSRPRCSNGSSASTTRRAATRTAGCSAPSTTRPTPRHDQHNQPVRNNGATSDP
jgi:putative transposase